MFLFKFWYINFIRLALVIYNFKMGSDMNVNITEHCTHKPLGKLLSRRWPGTGKTDEWRWRRVIHAVPKKKSL